MQETQFPLEDQDINELKFIAQEYEELSIRLGNIGLRRLELEHNEYQLNNIYSDLSTKQNLLVETYQKKYGKGSIDINQSLYIVHD